MAVYDLCNSSELYTFGRRVIDNEGLIFNNEKGKLQGLLEFYSCEKGIQSLHKLVLELKKIAALPDGWLKVADGRSIHIANNENNGNNNDDMSDWHDSNDNSNNDASEDSSIQLTEEGYQSVAKRCNNKQLFKFASRLIENEGLSLSGGEGMLNGMLEYYNCDNVQTLENMRAEFHRIAAEPDGWIVGRVTSGSNEGNENHANNAEAANTNDPNTANEDNSNEAHENNGNEANGNN
jgi:hypothetical protein